MNCSKMVFAENIIDEVLCRLPVKYLLRCRSVSKVWCHRIDSTPFIKKCLKRTHECNIGGGLIIKGGVKFFLADLDLLDDTSASLVEISDPIKGLLADSQFVGSSNGLICVSKNKMKEVFLVNPTTRKSRKLIPNFPPEFPSSSSPTESSIFGFGYDEASDDYKVVNITKCGSRFGGIIYSLNNNAWTQIHNIPTNFQFCSNMGIFVSGSLHWIARSTNCKKMIVAFDLELQQFKEVPFPPIMREITDYNFKCLVAIGGCLCVTDNYPSCCMDVWLIETYGNLTWHKAFTVEQRSTLGRFRSFNPIAFSKSRNDVLLLEVDTKKLVWYDLDTKTVKNVGICGIPVPFHSFVYTPSLLEISESDKKEKNRTKRRDDFLSKGFKLKL